MGTSDKFEDRLLYIVAQKKIDLQMDVYYDTLCMQIGLPSWQVWPDKNVRR